MTLTFAGLIRAHGDGGTGSTTIDPENTYVTTNSGATTTFDHEGTYYTTIGNTTTFDLEATYETTYQETTIWDLEETATTETTTETPPVSEEDFKLKIERKEVIEMDQDTFSYLFNYNFTFEKPSGFDEDTTRERSDDFVALEKGNPTDPEEPGHTVADVGSIKIKKDNDLKYWAKLGWEIKTKLQIPNDAQPLHVNRDCLKAIGSASIKLVIKEVVEEWGRFDDFGETLDENFSKDSPVLTRGVEATAVKKSTPVEGKPNKLEALVHTGEVEGEGQSPAGDIVIELGVTIAPEGDANSKIATWKLTLSSAWADSIDNIKDAVKTLVEENLINPEEYEVDIILAKPELPDTIRTQSARAFFSPWVKNGAGCNL